MNKKRRSKIAKALELLGGALDIVEQTREEEDEARDSMPENLQESNRYSDSEEASERMDDAISSMQDAVESLESI